MAGLCVKLQSRKLARFRLPNNRKLHINKRDQGDLTPFFANWSQIEKKIE